MLFKGGKGQTDGQKTDCDHNSSSLLNKNDANSHQLYTCFIDNISIFTTIVFFWMCLFLYSLLLWVCILMI